METIHGKLIAQIMLDETQIRSNAIIYNIPLVTTISGAEATVNGIEALIKKELQVKSLQEYHKQ